MVLIFIAYHFLNNVFTLPLFDSDSRNIDIRRGETEGYDMEQRTQQQDQGVLMILATMTPQQPLFLYHNILTRFVWQQGNISIKKTVKLMYTQESVSAILSK